MEGNGIIHLTEDDFKDLRGFEKAKQTLGRYSVIWKNEFSGKIHIGDCSYLYYKLQPSSIWDFYRKYIDDGKKNLYAVSDARLRGRSEKELTKEAVWMKHLIADETISLKECYYCIVMHVIIETYNGHLYEHLFKQDKEREGFKCEYVFGDDDSKYGIDMLVCDNDGKKLYAVQVKPDTFFFNTKKYDLMRDRVNALQKERLTLKKYGIPEYYVVYSVMDNGIEPKKQWWLHIEQEELFENDARLFKIGHFVNPKGESTFNKRKVENGGCIKKYEFIKV